MAVVDGCSWQFMAGIQGQRVAWFWSIEDGDAFGGRGLWWGSGISGGTCVKPRVLGNFRGS